MRSIYLFLKIETTCYEVEKVWISFDRKFSKELSKTSWMSKELFFSTFAIISYHLCPRRFFHRGNCWPLNWRTLISNLIEAIVYKSNFVIQQFSWKMVPPFSVWHLVMQNQFSLNWLNVWTNKLIFALWALAICSVWL